MLDEILEIKEKLQKLILDFDTKVRHNLIIEAKYNVPLKDEITPLLILDGQINVHKIALKALEEGKNIEQITLMVDSAKRNLINSTYKQQKKLIGLTNIIENLKKYSQAELDEAANTYKELVLKHHPALTLIDDQDERNRFALVRELYLQSDIENFYNAIEEIKFGTYEDNNLTDEQALKEINVAFSEFDREYERISKFDHNFVQLEKEVEDEMLLARNQAELRQRLYKAKKEIVEVYEETYNAFDGKIDFDIVKAE